MKEYEHLPEELQKEKERGVVLEEYLFDDGIREGRIYPEKKQWSTLIKTKSKKYIVSWCLGHEEWNHVYDENEETESYQDFNSIMIIEDWDTEDDNQEKALEKLEIMNEKNPLVIKEAFKPLIAALFQDNPVIKTQTMDILITLANRDIDLIKFIIEPVLKMYESEKEIKIKRKILLFLGEVGEKDSSLIKDALDIILKDLQTSDISLKITLLSILNKISKNNKDIIRSIIPNLIEFYHSDNMSLKKLAENILKNLGIDLAKDSNFNKNYE